MCRGKEDLMHLQKSVYSGQPAQSAQADLSRNSFEISQFPPCLLLKEPYYLMIYLAV